MLSIFAQFPTQVRIKLGFNEFWHSGLKRQEKCSMFSLYTPLASESSSIPNSSLHRGKMANEKENVYMYESCKDRILKRKNL